MLKEKVGSIDATLLSGRGSNPTPALCVGGVCHLFPVSVLNFIALLPILIQLGELLMNPPLVCMFQCGLASYTRCTHALCPVLLWIGSKPHYAL